MSKLSYIINISLNKFSLSNNFRFRWDMLTGDLELLDSYDGHLDVVYGTFDPRYLTR